MLSLPSSANVLKDLTGPEADSQSCFFIEKGHLMECIEVNSQKIVSLFFGPGEFAIQCHPKFSNLYCLDKVQGSRFSHENVIKTLRKFPESFVQYRGVRKDYYEKVAERLRILEMPVEKRLAYLQKKQPWVFNLANRKDIASYLGISQSILKFCLR